MLPTLSVLLKHHLVNATYSACVTYFIFLLHVTYLLHITYLVCYLLVCLLHSSWCAVLEQANFPQKNQASVEYTLKGGKRLCTININVLSRLKQTWMCVTYVFVTYLNMLPTCMISD